MENIDTSMWEEIVAVLTECAAATQVAAGNEYVAKGKTEAFQELDDKGAWLKKWAEHLEEERKLFVMRLLPHNKGGQANAERHKRGREVITVATLNGQDLGVGRSKQKLYERAFMVAWKKADGSLSKAQELWGSTVLEGKQEAGGRVWVAEANVTILGTSWSNMRRKLDIAQERGTFKGDVLAVEVTQPDGNPKRYVWGSQ